MLNIATWGTRKMSIGRLIKGETAIKYAHKIYSNSSPESFSHLQARQQMLQVGQEWTISTSRARCRR